MLGVVLQVSWLPGDGTVSRWMGARRPRRARDQTAGRSGCGRWGAPREQGGTGWSEPEWTLAPPRPALVGFQGHSGVCASLRTPAVVTAWAVSPFVGPFDAQESPACHSTKPPHLLPSPAPRNCQPLVDPGPQSGPPWPRPPSPAPRPGLGLRPRSCLHGP